jgi:hypothetical protein
VHGGQLVLPSHRFVAIRSSPSASITVSSTRTVPTKTHLGDPPVRVEFQSTEILSSLSPFPVFSPFLTFSSVARVSISAAATQTRWWLERCLRKGVVIVHGDLAAREEREIVGGGRGARECTEIGDRGRPARECVGDRRRRTPLSRARRRRARRGRTSSDS